MKLTEARLRQIIREELEGATELFVISDDDIEYTAENYGYEEEGDLSPGERYLEDLRKLVDASGVAMEYRPGGDPELKILGTLDAMKRFGELEHGLFGAGFSYDEKDFLMGLKKL